MSTLDKLDDSSLDDGLLSDFFLEDIDHSNKRRERVNSLQLRRKIEELEETRKLRQQWSYDDW